MQVESVKEAVDWTQNFHQNLARSLQEKKLEASDERTKMLLDYLGDCEQSLVSNLESLKSSADAHVLKTWGYEYMKDFPPKKSLDHGRALSDMDNEQIVKHVEERHNEVIELYDHLKSKAQIPEVYSFIEQIIDIERNEAQRIAQSANRLRDI